VFCWAAFANVPVGALLVGKRINRVLAVAVRFDVPPSTVQVALGVDHGVLRHGLRRQRQQWRRQRGGRPATPGCQPIQPASRTSCRVVVAVDAGIPRFSAFADQLIPLAKKPHA
jgi:hypothetical protein